MVEAVKVGWMPRYSAKAIEDSAWQMPSTSPSVRPASSRAASTMATSRARPVRSSSPLGDTSSATPTMAAAPRKVRSTRPDTSRFRSGVLRQLGERGHAVVVGLLGQPEHALADDVALHLVGAAVDGRRLGEE